MSIRNVVCLSVISEIYLLSVSRASTIYISLCKGLKYLLKIPYFIKNYSKGAGFLNFEALCLGRSKTLPYVSKKYHKNKRHLCLVTYIIWGIDVPGVMASYEISFDFITFFGYFHTLFMTIHVWIVVSPPNFLRLFV